MMPDAFMNPLASPATCGSIMAMPKRIISMGPMTAATAAASPASTSKSALIAATPCMIVLVS